LGLIFVGIRFWPGQKLEARAGQIGRPQKIDTTNKMAAAEPVL